MQAGPLGGSQGCCFSLLHREQLGARSPSHTALQMLMREREQTVSLGASSGSRCILRAGAGRGLFLPSAPRPSRVVVGSLFYKLLDSFRGPGSSLAEALLSLVSTPPSVWEQRS